MRPLLLLLLVVPLLLLLVNLSPVHAQKEEADDPLVGLANLFHLLSVSHYRESVVPLAALRHWANDDDGKHLCVWLSLPNVVRESVNLLWDRNELIVAGFADFGCQRRGRVYFQQAFLLPFYISAREIRASWEGPEDLVVRIPHQVQDVPATPQQLPPVLSHKSNEYPPSLPHVADVTKQQSQQNSPVENANADDDHEHHWKSVGEIVKDRIAAPVDRIRSTSERVADWIRSVIGQRD